MSERASIIARDAALWGTAGALVLAAHIGFAIWLTRHAEAAAPPGMPEPVSIDLKPPAPEPTAEPVEEVQPEPQPEPEPEPEPIELPELQELEPIEDFSELIPEPEVEEVTPPDVVSTPELTLSASTRPTRRPDPQPEPEPERQEPRREPEPQRQTRQEPAPQRQQAPAPVDQGAAGQGASGISPRQEANLIQQWGGRIGNCIQRRARLPRGVRGGGTVALSLVVSRNGNVQVLGIAGSSGVAELDQSAIQAAQRAGRCPAAPSGLNNASYNFTLPIQITR